MNLCRHCGLDAKYHISVNGQPTRAQLEQGCMVFVYRSVT